MPDPLVNRTLVPPRGWAGPHLQTARNQIIPRSYDLAALGSERGGLVSLDDGTGDRIGLIVHRSRQDAGSGPAVVALVHGLGGSSESVYVRATTAGLLRAGFNVARIDLRGAGRTSPHSSELYHAGRTEDLRVGLRMLASLPEARNGGAPSVAVIGFSLGGNAALKLLGEPPAGLPIVAGASVSAPLDLAVGAEHLHHMAFGLYERVLLRGLRAHALAERRGLTAEEREEIRGARRIAEFDDVFTARRNGWRDAAEYYAINSSGQYLASITVPTLVVHAVDDPMIPAGPYRAVDWSGLARTGPVRRAVTQRGGHVGFHQRGSDLPWFVPEIVAFLRAVTL